MKVLFVGDIVGNPGRKAARAVIPGIRKEMGIDLCIANCENAAGGMGITYAVAQELFNSDIDVITLGNHAWTKKDVFNFIDSDKRIIRPANYPKELPGKGSTIINTKKGPAGVLNLMGRVYMENTDCPFKAADKEIQYLNNFTNIIIVDMHAEATSEKYAMGWYLDGRVSCVLGTHTHVQTADERILQKGTGYITDVGMTGPYDGVIGVDKDIIMRKFLTSLPMKFEIAKGNIQFNAVFLDIDESNGRTISITRIMKILHI
ncbi:MAG: TIGR00282 family metallophosphoesterase [Clostridiaceae bacterium]|nr:TIGR00282 family metallophosphoesterase [Clostridiaceae bacterium]